MERKKGEGKLYWGFRELGVRLREVPSLYVVLGGSG
jgi:hypothetical protein